MAKTNKDKEAFREWWYKHGDFMACPECEAWKIWQAALKVRASC